MPENIFVIKASGEREIFDPHKVINSLRRSGASNQEIKEVLKNLYPKLKDGMTTHEIYYLVYNLLSQASERGSSVAGRYSLKRAILSLGPTGFPFEKFVAGILNELGYTTKVGVLVEGKCLTHEIDVLAQKDNETNMIEAKFHKKMGIKTDAKVILYVYARFLDIKDNIKPNPKPWLATNTKVTSEVKKYALCNNIQIISWDYPDTFSLRSLIDKTNLHPITTLTTLDNFTTTNLLNNGVVFCKDIDKAQRFFQNNADFDKVAKEARALCSIKNEIVD